MPSYVSSDSMCSSVTYSGGSGKKGYQKDSARLVSQVTTVNEACWSNYTAPTSEFVLS